MNIKLLRKMFIICFYLVFILNVFFSQITVSNITRIEAENYNRYHDTTQGNSGGAYRNDNVDIEYCNEGGYNVGWIEPGEWLEYDVNIINSGNYEIKVRTASMHNTGALRIYMDGDDITGQITFNPTGWWQNWISVSVDNINLSAGIHVMRIVFESREMNINYVEFTKNGNQPPTVKLTNPGNGSVYYEGNDLIINADAGDSDGTITKVDFYQNGILLESDFNQPYNYNWNNPAKGEYIITAEAYDNDGESVTSDAVLISVIETGSGFQYEGILPNGLVDEQRVSYKTAVNFDGSLVTITFESNTNLNQVFLYNPGFNNMVNSGSVWKTDLAGYNPGDTITWYFTAIGNGQADNSTVKHSWTIGAGSNNQSPIVKITSPSNGSQFNKGDNIYITADADDSDGSVIKVEFFQNGVLIGVDTESPYEIDWKNNLLGSFNITVEATDNDDAKSNDQINISVIGNDPLNLTVNKNVMIPDGSDSVILSVNKSGNAEYYADGIRLADNIFKTAKEGIHLVYAVLNGEKSNELQIIAKNPGSNLPYVFENNSRYADDEIYIALVGQIEGQGSVWMNMRTSAIMPVNETYNTIKAPDYTGGADPWLYADVFTKLSDIPNKTINIPKIFGCRIFIAFKGQIYLHFFNNGGYAAPNLENENDPNRGIRYELVELTWAENGLWTNTTRVDSYQYPMGLEVWGTDNTYKKVGEIMTHQNILSAWQDRVPAEFLACYKTNYYDIDGVIMQPSKIPEFDEGGVSEYYFKSYIDAIWNKYQTETLVTQLGERGTWSGKVYSEEMVLTGPDGTIAKISGRPTTQDAIEGKGKLAEDVPSTPDIHADLMIQAQFCAAINRGAIDLSIPSSGTQDWSDDTKYFLPDRTFNEYVKFWHSSDISYNSETYAFAYDDVFDHSSTIQNSNPVMVKVTIGGFAIDE